MTQDIKVTTSVAREHHDVSTVAMMGGSVCHCVVVSLCVFTQCHRDRRSHTLRRSHHGGGGSLPLSARVSAEASARASAEVWARASARASARALAPMWARALAEESAGASAQASVCGSSHTQF